jgi:hypothetical protein
MVIENQAIARALYFANLTRSNRAFFELMDALHSQMEADPKSHQDISTAFVEEMFDAADDNTVMLKAMDKQTSDAELGAYVRLLMKIVARDRV